MQQKRLLLRPRHRQQQRGPLLHGSAGCVASAKGRAVVEDAGVEDAEEEPLSDEERAMYERMAREIAVRWPPTPESASMRTSCLHRLPAHC